MTTPAVPTTQTFDTWFRARHPEIPLAGAQATLRLAGEGATVPFMARYRKEQTGNLDEVALQRVVEAKERWDQVLERQKFIVETIDKQKKLTPELKDKILSTFEADALEDLYLPYKQKRKSKATLAKEAGLEPFADWIWNCGHGTEKPLEGQTLELWGFTFRNEEKGFPDLDSVLQGAQDILTERLAEVQDLRQLVRTTTFEKGVLRTGKAEGAKPNSKFEKYFEYAEPIAALRKAESSHRYLAARRGWMEKELSLQMGGRPEDTEYEPRLLSAFEAAACSVPDSPGAELLQRAARAALKAHVLPSIEGEVHRALKEVADEAAIQVFAENLRRLLLASPFGSKTVVGIDPGLRTGSKLVVIDDSGKFLDSHLLRLHTDEQKAAAKQLLLQVLKAVPVRAIAVGNGTGGRETETFVRGVVKQEGLSVPVVLVNEAGASVYSASEAAREEFPALDVTVRGAISIARRLQDPLAELVKIDPKSIGVGQYQHDVSPHALKKSLDLVVDSCVNQVGVNLNTASYHLLAHVSGLGPALAKAVVEHRTGKGLFTERAQLLDIPRFTKKTFEQAAGFLRIPQAAHPLDNTGVHPERYAALEALAARLGKDVRDLLGSGVALVKESAELRQELGEFTFRDVVAELEKPGRDPRDEFVPFAYREDVHTLADLKPGMLCPGIVTNVTNFGAFVDIGVHQDGLVHVSQIADRFVKDPREAVHPGLHVTVRVLEVNLDKQQIALTLREPQKKRAEGAAPRRPRGEKPARRERPARGAKPAAEGKPAHDARPRRPSGPRPGRGPQPPRPAAPPAAASPSPRPAAPAPPRDTPRREPPRRETPAPGGFANNPFAVLAGLKKTLKR